MLINKLNLPVTGKDQLKKGQFARSLALSIAIAALAIIAIEGFGFGGPLKERFFANNTELPAFNIELSKKFVENLRGVMLLLFSFFVIYAFIFTVVLEIIAIGYFLVTSRWRKPTIFIAYKNTEDGALVNTNKIAIAIKAALQKKGFKTRFFDFNANADHSTVNYDIKHLIRNSDAMLVVPDPYRPSYVNAEIAAAYQADKPVFIIRHTKDQKLPDTANAGHTVLLLDKLKKEKYEPLFKVLTYVHRVWYKRIEILLWPLLTFLFPFMELDDFWSALIAIIIFALVVIGLVYFKVPILITLFVLKIIIAIIGVYGAFIVLNEINGKVNLEKVIKQTIIDAGSTYDYFVEAGFDKKILACIDRVGLAS